MKLHHKISGRLFGYRLENLTVDDLYEEKADLERQEKLILGDIHILSENKRQLFEKGYAASEAERRSLAGKLKIMGHRLKMKNAIAERTNNRFQAIDQLIFIKEMDPVGGSGLLNVISKVPQSRVMDFLSRFSVKDAVENGKIDTFRRNMENEFGLIGTPETDTATAQLLDVWNKGDQAQMEEEFQLWERQHADEEEVHSAWAAC